MFIIDLGRIALMIAVLLGLGVLLISSDPYPARRWWDLMITQLLKLKFWWWRGYYLSFKDSPHSVEEVNLCAKWSLVHGCLVGSILVSILLIWSE